MIDKQENNLRDRPAVPFTEVIAQLPDKDRAELEQLYQESLKKYQEIKDRREAKAK